MTNLLAEIKTRYMAGVVEGEAAAFRADVGYLLGRLATLEAFAAKIRMQKVRRGMYYDEWVYGPSDLALEADMILKSLDGKLGEKDAC